MAACGRNASKQSARYGDKLSRRRSGEPEVAIQPIVSLSPHASAGTGSLPECLSDFVRHDTKLPYAGGVLKEAGELLLSDSRPTSR
jgi:hypothetical protein